MKFYNICKGCGENLQFDNPDLKDYSPKKDAPLCQRCYKITHYGEKKNNLEEYSIEKHLNEIAEQDTEVIMIIDSLNPYATLIDKINNWISPSRLTILINKIDILPMSINGDSIIDWVYKIAKTKGIYFKNISIVSSKNKHNIDRIYDYIVNQKENVSIIGYSNVGKSSFIKTLYKSKLIKVQNTVSNTIGTTLKPIELDFELKKIIDYPGFLLIGNYQNLLNLEQLNRVMPKKEIKSISLQIKNNSLYSISDLFYFKIEKAKDTNYQLLFSNEINIEKINIDKKLNQENWEWKQVNLNKGKQDLIISGLGIITLFNVGQTIKIYLPKIIDYYIVDSIYN